MSAQPQQQEQNPFEEKTSQREAPGSNMGAISNRPGNAVSRCVEKVSVNTWILIMRIVNILNACMLLAACILSFVGDLATGSKKEGDNISSVFLSLYIGMFGLILLIFETRSKLIGSERWIRRTFGFMFTYWGRTCFLIFVGCLNIGLSDSRNEDKEESQDGSGDVSRDLAHRMVIATASVTVINAVFNCMILCSHSGFLNMQEKTTNPADLEEQQVKAYLEAHPELAAQAAQGFETESSQPPPVAADFGSGTAKDSGNSGSKSPTSKQAPQADAENPFGDNTGSSRPPPAPEKSASQNQSQQSSGTGGSTGGGASAGGGGGKKKKKKNKKNTQKETSGGTAASSSGSGQKNEDNPFEDDNPFA